MDRSECVYVGFNRRVAALDRRTGEIIWDWKAPSGSGYVSLLFDEGVLFAAVNGHTYCLTARAGRSLRRRGARWPRGAGHAEPGDDVRRAEAARGARAQRSGTDG